MVAVSLVRGSLHAVISGAPLNLAFVEGYCSSSGTTGTSTNSDYAAGAARVPRDMRAIERAAKSSDT